MDNPGTLDQQKPHVLDNLIWHSLIGEHAHIAGGEGGVRFYPEDMSNFVGLENARPALLDDLYSQWQRAAPAILITADELIIPEKWKLIYNAGIRQFTAANPEIKPVTADIQPLTAIHSSQMYDLADLTKPGPFLSGTYKYGNYHGFFSEDKLVAMAGYRFSPPGYTEISAVCTHPEYTGRGYASAMVQYMINHVCVTTGNIPMLHASLDNTSAISVYQKAGFVERKLMNVYVLEKAG